MGKPARGWRAGVKRYLIMILSVSGLWNHEGGWADVEAAGRIPSANIEAASVQAAIVRIAC